MPEIKKLNRDQMNLPDFIYPGAIVRVMDWVGVVLKVEGAIITIESPKRVILMQKSLDVLDYSIAPQLWQPAAIDDLLQEAEIQQNKLARVDQKNIQAGSHPSMSV